MKRVSIGICLMLAVIAAASLYPSRAQEVDNAPPTTNWAEGNPLKIALLRWYQANTTTRFKVGSQPYGVAFDGANIWTANYGDGTVTKLRTSDGAVPGKVSRGRPAHGGDLRRSQHLGLEQQ